MIGDVRRHFVERARIARLAHRLYTSIRETRLHLAIIQVGMSATPMCRYLHVYFFGPYPQKSERAVAVMA
jgi:hypothetical protein